MRYYEFLLEYRRDKTEQVYGDKILYQLISDRSYPAVALSTAVQQELKHSEEQGRPGVIRPEVRNSILTLFFEKLENADPTKTKEYVQWMTKCYVKEKIKLEDIVSKGADWLERYHQFKSRRFFTGQYAEYANIMNISFHGLSDIANSHVLLSKLQDAEESTVNKGHSKTVYDDAEFRIIIPLDEDAAKYYGQGTQWCTAARNNNMFERYNSEGLLYIILPKHPKFTGEKYQFHFESGQFMDLQDEEINLVNFLDSHENIKQFFLNSWDAKIKKFIVFASDDSINNILEEVNPKIQDYVMGIYSQKEADDGGYYELLRDEGFIDNNGDILDDAPTYADYNDHAKDLLNDLDTLITYNQYQWREFAKEYYNDEQDLLTLSKFDDLYYYVVDKYFSQEWLGKVVIQYLRKLTKFH